MIRILTILAFAFALVVAPATSSSLTAHAHDHAEDTQSVVVHLSHFTDDLHAAFMALNIGTMLAESGEAEVTLFLDLEAVRCIREYSTCCVGRGSYELRDYIIESMRKAV